MTLEISAKADLPFFGTTLYNKLGRLKLDKNLKILKLYLEKKNYLKIDNNI